MTAADVRFGVGLALLIGTALAVLTLAGVHQRRAILTAVARAALQLAFVAAALRGVFATPPAVVAVLAVMLCVAVWTSARRISAHPGAARAAGCAIPSGALVAIAIVLGPPMLPRDTRSLIAVSGIVIGGCMTSSTLTGRYLADSMHRQRDEVEAWLALGATSRVAVRELARGAVFNALVPALDQTRTVGLVTLPGAFVGALVGGASAGEAARFQLTVLVALLCAETVTAVILAWLLGAPRTLPGPVV